MSTARFTVTYDGPELEHHTMDAVTLGGAMVAMAKLVEHSSALLYGVTTPVKVDVAADFESGSFSYHIIAMAIDAGSVGKQIIDSINMDTLLTILGVGGGGGGLIALVKFLKGRKAKEVAPISGTGNVSVTDSDGNTQVFNGPVIQFYDNATIRADLSGVVAPLEREGIDEFRAGRGKVASVTITEDEVGYFEPPPPTGEVLLDRESEEVVQIMGTYFKPGRKWMFALPDGTTFLSHLDPTYAKRVVPGGDRYGAGDAFRVILHTTVIRTSDGRLHAKREIVKVIHLIPATVQLNFLADQDDPRRLGTGKRGDGGEDLK